MEIQQVGGPILLQNGKASPLKRIDLGESFQDEDWIQRKLFENPQLIPFEEIEPALRGSVPLAREVESGAGPIDVLYTNADGLLTLVETKLWRNPESRRKVVAQLIDYAASLSRMSYEQLADAVDDASPSRISLCERVRQRGVEIDQTRFHDNLSRNLRRGRFLLLAVGDGIREDVESMADFLNRQPHLGFTLGLLELRLFRLNPDNDDSILMQPHLLARTREVVRGVIEIRDGKVVDTLPPGKPTVIHQAKVTEDQFLDSLASLNKPDAVEFARWVFETAPKHKLEIEWGKHTASIVYRYPETGDTFRFGALNIEGCLSITHMVSNRYVKLGLSDSIWRTYLTQLASLMPGAEHIKDKSKAGIVWEYVTVSVADPDKKLWEDPPLELLAPNKERWMDLIDQTISEINDEMEKLPTP